MSIESDFRATLAAHSALVSLVGTGIALNAVPEGTGYPAIVYAVAHSRTLGIDNSLLADQALITVQCWSETAAGAEAVADAVVSAIEDAPVQAGAVVLDRGNTFDQDLGLDGVVLSVEWWG